MNRWVLGVAILALASPANAQETCPPTKPLRLISTMAPVVGQSPLWVTTGASAPVFKGPNNPVQVLWVRDISVKGMATLTGKAKGGTGKVGFSNALYGMPDSRFMLDKLGIRPQGIKQTDLEKYSFHRSYVFFSAPGCYEIQARVGMQPSVIYLNVLPPGPADK